MNKICALAIAAVPFWLTSCATPPPAESFHDTDGTALVLDSLDDQTSQMVRPAMTAREANDYLFSQIKGLAQHQTAVVILENYSESQVGPEFRVRGTPIFVALRSLGYQHIVFVQGTGSKRPEGLLTLAEYD